jgi:hypothetical protein
MKALVVTMTGTQTPLSVQRITITGQALQEKMTGI